ncbi:UvrD-helicase domain-containing protein, partial [Candidatus Dependentiae bacterium]|nr:UvrD-helicase domain-containing protein [Candidatus Dependentiae bacterium]
HINTPLLVIAGAGSGKTKVITEKIVYLLDNQCFPASKIFAITFTNKAAHEMRVRLRTLLANKQAKKVTISTFHSLGLMILKREHTFFNLNARFSIFDENDKKTILQSLIEKLYPNFSDKVDLFGHQIALWKNNLLSPNQLKEQIIDKNTQISAHLYTEYVQTLKIYNAVDFDDLIYLPVLMLQNNAAKRELWQNKIRYLLIDEYQDTNQAQYILMKLLTGARAAFTAVGDDDQSIYAWRGAQVENLNQLQQDFANLTIIKLEQNYRSTQLILRAANTLILNNPHLYVKKLWSKLSLGEPIRIISTDSEHDEVIKTIQDLERKKIRQSLKYGDFTILYRSNHQARLFEQVLKEQNIPYQISGHISFFSRTEIKDLMAYFKIMINPEDDASFLRIINTPKRSIGVATLNKLSQYAKSRTKSLFNSAHELALKEKIAPKQYQNLNDFISWLSNQKIILNHAKDITPIKQFINELNYEQWLKQNSQQKTIKNKLKLIQELLQWLEKLFNKYPAKNFADIIQHLCLLDIIDGQQDKTDSSQLQLMTLHAAKGLEFPHVYLVGMEEEILPHQSSIDDK